MLTSKIEQVELVLKCKEHLDWFITHGGSLVCHLYGWRGM